MWYDELLPISSPRLAKLGFYSSRNDIPKYKIGSDQDCSKGIMQAFILNRIHDKKQEAETGRNSSKQNDDQEVQEDKDSKDSQPNGE